MARNRAASISDILAGFGQGASRAYEIDVPSGILKSKAIPDYARAMEALDQLELVVAPPTGSCNSQEVIPKVIAFERAVADYTNTLVSEERGKALVEH